MKRKLKLITVLLFVAFAGHSQKAKLTPTQALVKSQIRLELELKRLSEISGGIVGIEAIHVESGQVVSQNSKDRFPMASSYKIPIAIQLLTRIDSGKVSLDDLIEIQKSDLHPGSGMLSDRFNWPNSLKPGVALSVRSLMELMLLISDNSATDICLRLAGGTNAVNACMKRWGIKDLQVDRPTAWLISDWLGMVIPMNKPWSPSYFDSLEKTLNPEQMKKSSEKFDADVKDTSSPEAMSQLLLKLYTNALLKTDSKILLLDIMKRCESGQARLKGLLPQGTEVMHKTGTIGMTTNDVGIITLPGNAGHVVISVFVKSSKKEIPERERAIAEVTRTIYDYFIFNY